MIQLAESPTSSTENLPEAFTWLATHADETQISRRDLSRLLGYDESTVSKVLNGSYRDNPKHIVSAIEKYRATVLPPVEMGEEFPFVDTKLTRSIWGYIDLVRLHRKMGLVIGDSQAGKTRSIKEYVKKHADDKIVHLELDNGHKSKVVAELCELLGVSDKYNTAAREIRLKRLVTRKHVFLIDEIQHCASRPRAGGRTGSEKIDTIEFFRRLKDTTGCIVVLFGTTEALAMMNGKGHGHDSGHILLQTLRRSLPTYELKSKPIRSDLNAFAAKLGLPPATDAALTLQTVTIDRDGLGNWLTLLQAGNGRAAAQGRAMTWSDVLDSDTEFQKFGGAK